MAKENKLDIDEKHVDLPDGQEWDARARGRQNIQIGMRGSEFILNHGQLAQVCDAGAHAVDNAPFFAVELVSRRLDVPWGTYVAYHKGGFCGQSADRDALYVMATDYYGASDLAVFHVPEKKPESVRDIDFSDALGWF